MAATFRAVATQRRKSFQLHKRPWRSSKVSKEKGVGIRSKLWEDLVGVGKGLLGPRAWEMEHGYLGSGGNLGRAMAGKSAPLLDLQWPPPPRRHPTLHLMICRFILCFIRERRDGWWRRSNSQSICSSIHMFS